MSVDENYFTMPDGANGASFTKEEWERADRAIQKIKDRLAETCRHLIRSPGEPKRRKVDWDKIRAERERLADKERDALRVAGGFE
ncbi:hypothetical protein LCGC14_0769650 [marine sediment metagenome]|uniref:Uncharacterized protein n=1 Tax=marine sediment metagenome TaxID=412755 RepID=A0A0F9T5P6_9ZZZZ